MFETNVFRNEFHQFLIISIMILFNFERNGAHLIMKNDILKKNIIHSYFEHTKWFLKHHPFASSFEHWNFASNGTWKEEKNDTSNY